MIIKKKNSSIPEWGFLLPDYYFSNRKGFMVKTDIFFKCVKVEL